VWLFVPPTCFDRYNVIMKKVYTKAYKYGRFCQRYAYIKYISMMMTL